MDLQLLTSAEIFALYRQALKLLEGSLFNEVAEILARFRAAEQAAPSPVAESARRLLALRLSLRQNHLIEDADLIERLDPREEWLKAERAFVLGLHAFHWGRFEGGATHFAEATRWLKSADWSERIALAAYNAYIGRLNAGTWNSIEERVLQLKPVEVLAHEQGCRRTKALVARQMSYFLHDLEALESARHRILEAVEYFQVFGPASDAHLALLQAADISLDMGEHVRAREFAAQVLAPLDSRVLFPFAYIQSRLQSTSVDPKDFSVVGDVWRWKWERRQHPQETTVSLRWDRRRHCLVLGPQTVPFREGGKEALLLQYLMNQPASKNALIEFLWPEAGDSWTLENRLHKLISRLNQKVPSLIIYDGRVYRCALKVVAS